MKLLILWVKDEDSEKEMGFATFDYASLPTELLNVTGSNIGYKDGVWHGLLLTTFVWHESSFSATSSYIIL